MFKGRERRPWMFKNTVPYIILTHLFTLIYAVNIYHKQVLVICTHCHNEYNDMIH